MLYLILLLLILSYIVLYFLLRNILKEKIQKIESIYQEAHQKYQVLYKDLSGVIQEKEKLNQKLEDHRQLYEVSRQLYKFLDEDDIFPVFKDILSNFVNFKECFIVDKSALDIKLDEGDLVFSLRIDSSESGFLVARGVNSPSQQEKFYIMAQQFLVAFKRARLYKKVEALSIVDELTGLFNRRYFLERFKEEIERAQRLGFSFSFIMMDIDNFKTYNDSFGHLVGDYILKEVSRTIQQNIRHIDLACRYGGEEFCILLPQIEKDKAYFVGERIRKSFEERKIKVYDEEIAITVSMGVASFPQDSHTVEGIIEKSDQALYLAKRRGKNQVSAYQEIHKKPCK